MKIKDWFKRLIAGMAIGVGAAIPGVSGAAIAVIFKIYETIISAINSIRKQFIKSVLILLPIVLGVILSVIPCIILFDKALDSFVFGLTCIFAGFLIGSLPSILEQNKGVQMSKKHIFLIITGFTFVACIGVISVLLSGKIDVNSLFDNPPFWLYFIMIPVGIIASVALTIPGLSGSLILLIIGFYDPLVSYTVSYIKDFINNGDWSSLGIIVGIDGCFAVGCLIGVILVSKIMKNLLQKFHHETYSAITGFILGSILVLFFNGTIYSYYQVWSGSSSSSLSPILPMWAEMMIGFGLLLCCIIGSFLLIRLSKKNKEKGNQNNGLGN